MGKVIQNTINGHRWTTGGKPWPPGEIDNFRSDNLVCGTFRWQKNEKKITCNFDGNFAKTYSGKAITQSKVSNSTMFEDMDAGLVSNDAAV